MNTDIDADLIHQQQTIEIPNDSSIDGGLTNEVEIKVNGDLHIIDEMYELLITNITTPPSKSSIPSQPQPQPYESAAAAAAETQSGFAEIVSEIHVKVHIEDLDTSTNSGLIDDVSNQIQSDVQSEAVLPESILQSTTEETNNEVILQLSVEDTSVEGLQNKFEEVSAVISENRVEEVSADNSESYSGIDSDSADSIATDTITGIITDTSTGTITDTSTDTLTGTSTDASINIGTDEDSERSALNEVTYYISLIESPRIVQCICVYVCVSSVHLYTCI